MVHLTCHLPTTPELFPARPQRKALQDLRKHSASPPPPSPTSHPWPRWQHPVLELPHTLPQHAVTQQCEGRLMGLELRDSLRSRPRCHRGVGGGGYGAGGRG